MAVLAGSVDELQTDLLHSLLSERSQQGLKKRHSCNGHRYQAHYCVDLASYNLPYLSKSDNSLLGSHAASLDHDKVLVDLSVVREASHGSNGLVSWVIISGSVVLDDLM